MSAEKNINVLLLVFFVIMMAFVLISDKMIDYHEGNQVQEDPVLQIDEPIE